MTWQRALGPSRCGLCGEPIAVGAPVLLVSEAGLRRCGACATKHYDQTPPVEWPVAPPQPVRPMPPRAVFDAKLAQLADQDQ